MKHSWMMTTYRERTWPYLQTPDAGDQIQYMNDGIMSRVAVIRWDRIVMSDGMIYRRRGNTRRMWAWVSAVLTSTFRTSSVTASSAVNTLPQSRTLRPAHYVHVVNLP